MRIFVFYLNHKKMIKIAVINQKGGVGKSTSCRNLGDFFSKQGLKTLLVDIDPQANLSQLSRIPDDIEHCIVDVFRNKETQIFSVSDNLDIVPSSLSFAGIELEIIGAIQRELFLAKALKRLDENYRLCLIDCPPAINIITTNALAAAEWVLIPMEASLLSFNGLSKMLELIMMVRDGLNPDLSILGIFITKYTSKTVVAREILEQIRQEGLELGLLNSKIRQFEAFKKSENARKSIFEYPGGNLAASDYRNLGYEILDKLNIKS
jgi:chromosome partitioning protein